MRQKVIWREEEEVPEPFRAGWNLKERVLGIGEHDAISKIHGFTGHSADGRELRAGAGSVRGGGWPGVWGLRG